MEMWGTCDGQNIIFQEVRCGEFECTVPADFEDGVYILELWMKTDADVIIYTTALVYLCDSKLTYLELLDDDITVMIQDDIQVKVVVDYEHQVYQRGKEICSVLDIQQEKRTYNHHVCDIYSHTEL